MGEIEFGCPGTKVEPLRLIELTLLKQRVAAVYQVNNCSRKLLRVIVISQDVEQTLTRWTMIGLDEFAFTAREADAVPDIEAACATRHCYIKM